MINKDCDYKAFWEKWSKSVVSVPTPKSDEFEKILKEQSLEYEGISKCYFYLYNRNRLNQLRSQEITDYFKYLDFQFKLELKLMELNIK